MAGYEVTPDNVQRLESIGLLAGGIAHDLNNILQPMMMIAPMLRSEIKDPINLDLLATVERSAQRGADIIRQILTFSRGLKSEPTLVQTRHLANEIGDIAQETFPRSITVCIHAPKDLWLVNGDAGQIQQVFMNLVVNARDAMPDGGTLTVTGSNQLWHGPPSADFPDAKPGQYVVWTVQDTGSGIPPGIITRIFDPFFTTKPLGKGTGLGLSTVASLVRKHEGFLHVASQLGQGTTFQIYFPAQPAQELLAATRETTLPVGHGKKILLVDDEESIRRSMSRAFGLKGFEVVTAQDGQAALELLANPQNNIQLVVLDIMMPRMDGMKLVRAIRAEGRDVHIIVASGGVSEVQKAELLQLGVEQILEKPFSSDALAVAVRTQNL